MSPHSCRLMNQHDFKAPQPDFSVAANQHVLFVLFATAESSAHSRSSSILAVSPMRSSKMLSASCIFSWASREAVPMEAVLMEAAACTHHDVCQICCEGQHDEVACMS